MTPLPVRGPKEVTASCGNLFVPYSSEKVLGSARVPHGCRLPQWGHWEASVLSGVAFPLGAVVTRLASLTPRGVRVMGWGTGGGQALDGAHWGRPAGTGNEERGTHGNTRRLL